MTDVTDYPTDHYGEKGEFNYFYVNGLAFTITRVNNKTLLCKIWDEPRTLERQFFISGLEHKYGGCMCYVYIKRIKDFDRYIDVLKTLKTKSTFIEYDKSREQVVAFFK